MDQWANPYARPNGISDTNRDGLESERHKIESGHIAYMTSDGHNREKPSDTFSIEVAVTSLTIAIERKIHCGIRVGLGFGMSNA